jgi:hypothetical protein
LILVLYGEEVDFVHARHAPFVPSTGVMIRQSGPRPYGKSLQGHKAYPGLEGSASVWPNSLQPVKHARLKQGVLRIRIGASSRHDAPSCERL